MKIQWSYLGDLESQRKRVLFKCYSTCKCKWIECHSGSNVHQILAISHIQANIINLINIKEETLFNFAPSEFVCRFDIKFPLSLSIWTNIQALRKCKLSYKVIENTLANLILIVPNKSGSFELLRSRSLDSCNISVLTFA